MQDPEGQIAEAHSISAGLDYPGTGPEHAYLRDIGRARYEAIDDDEALAAFHELAAARGHHPGAGVRPTRSRSVLADAAEAERMGPRVPVGPRRQGPRRGPRRDPRP